ncbi:MAG: hypothetical protein M3070_16250 [Actinomycetota bacterium]|nr:hypothetical protein [Actinomycetota bacterium]
MLVPAGVMQGVFRFAHALPDVLAALVALPVGDLREVAEDLAATPTITTSPADTLNG